MSWFLLLLIVPICWIIFAKVKYHTFSWKDVGLQFGMSLIICAVLAVGTVASKLVGALDTEILNGYVTEKYDERVSCEHSYEICTDDGNGNQTCTTYYDHPFDIDWVVETTVGDMTIDRVDSQGRHEPPRFSEVIIGEHAAVTNTYLNYVKAVPESVVNIQFDEDHDMVVPKYPSVFDYYRVNRAISARSSISNNILEQWNVVLNDELRTVGAEHQVNVVVIVTEQSQSFTNVLENEWLRGKKNDVIVVIGNNGNNIEWVKSFGWAEKSIVFREIEQQLTKTTLNDPNIPYIIVDEIKQHYTREPFERYKYLADELSPKWWAIFLAFIFNIAVTLFVGIKLIKLEG